MTDAVITTLAVLGVMTQALLVALLVVGALWLLGVDGPWRFVRDDRRLGALARVRRRARRHARQPLLLRGGPLHPVQALLVPADRHVLLVLLALPALRHDRRAAQYLLPLPIVGLFVSGWHILVERGVIEDARSCQISAPGGCATKWIEELGYVRSRRWRPPPLRCSRSCSPSRPSTRALSLHRSGAGSRRIVHRSALTYTKGEEWDESC